MSKRHEQVSESGLKAEFTQDRCEMARVPSGPLSSKLDRAFDGDGADEIEGEAGPIEPADMTHDADVPLLDAALSAVVLGYGLDLVRASAVEQALELGTTPQSQRPRNPQTAVNPGSEPWRHKCDACDDAWDRLGSAFQRSGSRG